MRKVKKVMKYMILKVEKILKRKMKWKEDDNIDDDVVAMSDRERR